MNQETTSSCLQKTGLPIVYPPKWNMDSLNMLTYFIPVETEQNKDEQVWARLPFVI